MPDTGQPISDNRREIRKFGTIALIFFGLLCLLGLWRQKTLVSVFFGLLSLLGAGFLFLPGPLRPLYSGWIKGTQFIGKITTMIILTLAYYLVITPTAFIKRIFGGRPLPLIPDRNASSYWITRSESAQPKERFVKRY